MVPDTRDVTDERGSRPGPNCPSWCEDCPEDPGPPGAHWHNGPVVAVSGWNGWAYVNVGVKPAHLEVPKPQRESQPEGREPHIELEISEQEDSGMGDPVSFTVANARQLALALTIAADAIDNERQNKG